MAEVTEEDAEVRNKWRWKIRCGDLDERSRKEKILNTLADRSADCQSVTQLVDPCAQIQVQTIRTNESGVIV